MIPIFHHMAEIFKKILLFISENILKFMVDQHQQYLDRNQKLEANQVMN